MARALASLLAALALAHACVASDVVQGTSSNFQRKVLDHPGVVMVEFFAPWCGHCKALKPEWEKAATALKGIVRVVAVDATVEQQLATQYGVQGYPTIKVFGADKAHPSDYQGAREASAIVQEAFKAARRLAKDRLSGKASGSSRKSSSGSAKGSKNAVVELTDANFDAMVLNSNDFWMVEFYAPWCGHCKNLAPHWRSAASKLEGQVKLGAVDATVNSQLASRFNIRGFPTIKLFPAGAGKSDSSALEYQGGRTTTEIVDYALAKLDEMGPPPEVGQLTNNAQMEELCGGKRICVLALLPHILDSGKDGRNSYIDTLKDVAKLRRRDPFTFAWIEGGAQPALEEALELNFGFPAVVALNKGKARAAVHHGAYNTVSVSQFLTALTTGRATTLPLETLPALQTTEAWNGEEPPPPEEEFDLADLMADEL
mmetsp:Transcript_5793/g.18430  ORF Transcript_5793/g.18430 Transcript_5793/m.18430 type:complete len:429 (+) Transcript_5793:3-1289(+)